MDLLTPTLCEQLIANGSTPADHVPVVKFFNPVGAATWLFSELDCDGDTLFGLCDLGFGCPELGSASLAEIAALHLPFGLTFDRDLSFAPQWPLSVYADAARLAQGITEHPDILARAASARTDETRRPPPSIPPDGG